MLTGGKNVIPYPVRDVAHAAVAFSARIGPERHFAAQQDVEEALTECCAPQNVTVIGLTGSGKSSTLEALAGERFCSRVTSTAALIRWQYRPHPAPHTHEWVQDLFYPSDTLLNLEFWDTLGLEQPNAAQRLKHIVPKADAILVVISAQNNHADVIWDYLITLEERLYSRMILAITHTELLPFEQLQVFKEELRSMSRDKLGIQLPLYPVTPAGEQAGEGVEALRACVQEALKRSPVEDRRVERLLLATDRLLEEQGKVLNELNRLSRMDSSFLTGIDREIDRIQLQMEEEMPARLKAYAEYVQDNVPRLGKKAARQLGRFLSIRRTMILHKLPPVIDEWFYELIKHGIEERHAYYNKEFLNICQTHWTHVRPRVKEQWDCDIGDFPSARLQTDLDTYKERLGRSVYMPLKDFGIKPCLSNLFLEQEDVMRTELKLMLVLVILGGLLGCFGEHTAAFACLGLAMLLWIGGNSGLLWMQYKLAKQIVAAASEMHIAISCGLRIPLYEAMISGISDYRKLYSDIRGQVAGGVEHLTPLLNARYDLFYKLTVQKHRFRL